MIHVNKVVRAVSLLTESLPQVLDHALIYELQLTHVRAHAPAFYITLELEFLGERHEARASGLIHAYV